MGKNYKIYENQVFNKIQFYFIITCSIINQNTLLSHVMILSMIHVLTPVQYATQPIIDLPLSFPVQCVTYKVLFLVKCKEIGN